MKLRGIVVVALVVLIAAAPAGAASRKERARAAAGYLISQQEDDGSFPAFSPIGSTADAVVSLVAAKRGPDEIADAIRYLEDNSDMVDLVGEKAKVVMALVAAGEDPRAFDGRDLVAEITATETEEGRYGDTTAVFDQALAVLALAAADETPSDAAVGWLAAAQCRDGGWQFDEPASENDDKHCYDGTESDFFTTDTNTTSLAVQALDVAGGTAAEKPFRYFKNVRDDVKHGWGYAKGFLTDANSTALVIQAYSAEDRDLPDKAMKALKKLQYDLCFHHDGTGGGGFAFTWEDEDGDGHYEKTPPDVGATIGAIPGLLKKPFPIGPVETKPVQVCVE